MSNMYVKAPREKVKEKPSPNVTWKFFDSDLLDRIQGKEVEPRKTRPELIVRESCGA